MSKALRVFGIAVVSFFLSIVGAFFIIHYTSPCRDMISGFNFPTPGSPTFAELCVFPMNHFLISTAVLWLISFVIIYKLMGKKGEA